MALVIERNHGAVRRRHSRDLSVGPDSGGQLHVDAGLPLRFARAQLDFRHVAVRSSGVCRITHNDRNKAKAATTADGRQPYPVNRTTGRLLTERGRSKTRKRRRGLYWESGGPLVK